MKYQYRIGQFTLNCDRSIGGLEPASSNGSKNWFVRTKSPQDHFIKTSDAVEVWRDSNDVLSVLQIHETFVVQFLGLADFLIDPVAQSIHVFSSVECPPETIDHLLLDQVLPRAIAHCHGMVLHAAGILIGDQVVGFLGETGHGKSTLANSFMQAGQRLLSDDALFVDATSAAPTAQALYPCVRLWPESVEGLYEQKPHTAAMAHYSTKQRVLIEPSSCTTSEQHPIGAVFVLKMVGADSPVSIDRLGQQSACIELIKNSFQLTPNDPGVSIRMFEQSIAFASTTPVYELSYPKGFGHLAHTRERIEQHLKDQTSQHGLRQ